MLFKLFLLVGLLLLACYAVAHPGGLDKYGCHWNRTVTPNNYHCHRGPLAGQSFANKDAMLAALVKLNTNTPTERVQMGKVWVGLTPGDFEAAIPTSLNYKKQKTEWGMSYEWNSGALDDVGSNLDCQIDLRTDSSGVVTEQDSAAWLTKKAGSARSDWGGLSCPW